MGSMSVVCGTEHVSVSNMCIQVHAGSFPLAAGECPVEILRLFWGVCGVTI